MATKDVTQIDRNDPSTKLLQFLFVGKEYPNYQPGNWFVHKYYLAKNVKSIEELAENVDTQLVPIQLILKAIESGLVPNPETLVFALAVCCRQQISESLRCEAHKIVKDVCKTPEHFILFVKFAFTLSNTGQLDANNATKHGWGNGFRKAINNWYLSKDPLELVQHVTRCKGRYGWKHKDIIKLSHPRPLTLEQEVIFTYIIHGLAQTKAYYPDLQHLTNKLIKYIDQVEQFKHCENETEAANLLEEYNLTLDHVPGHMLKSKEVWCSLVSTMNVVTLLNNFQRIHNLELLEPDTAIVARIIDQITNTDLLLRDKVHPALVYITLNTYHDFKVPLTYEIQKVKKLAKKPLRPPRNPNYKIVEALLTALKLSFDHLQPTGLRYLITINVSKVMMKSPAWHTGVVTGLEAGGLMAHALLCCEKSVTVATFQVYGVQSIYLKKTGSIFDTLERLHGTLGGEPNLSEPILMALRGKTEYDVFINIVDQIHEKSDKCQKAIAEYRLKMKLPDVKLINWAVCSATSHCKEKRDKNILTINGFDATVPTVIEAFAKSLF